MTSIPSSTPSVIYGTKAIIDFLAGGRAVFTLVSKKTNARYTYRCRSGMYAGISFIDVLVGPENTKDYSFVGVFRHSKNGINYAYSKESEVPEEAASIIALEFLATCLGSRTELPMGLEFWHSGRCGRCGRLLTDPESITTGLGPVCRAKG